MNKIDAQNRINEIMKIIIPNERIEENYLIDNINFEKKDVVMILGINPGNIPDDGNRKENKPLNKLMCFDQNFLQTLQPKETRDKLLKEIDADYRKYHFPNYNLFLDKKVDGKMFWADEDSSLAEELREKVEDELKEMYDIVIRYEKNKKGPLIVFNDLFWYANSNQKEVEMILKNFKKNEEENLDTYLKEIIDIYIDYYNPKIIAVTNSYASKLLLKALFNSDDNYIDVIEYNNKKVTFIFSGMVSGQRALDTHSYTRLKKQVTEVYIKGE